MTTPSRTGDSAMYFSVPSSARSPALSSTGVVCVWKPAGWHVGQPLSMAWRSVVESCSLAGHMQPRIAGFPGLQVAFS